ncbi:MAG: hypothetical protein H6666_09450 [Ardenticatenaceae bacterium]|nr:hypothetical protein [Anaerolineales bacterium]MCB8918140.1 hypothetical protein [Ardenticatenaceae bacterium]
MAQMISSWLKPSLTLSRPRPGQIMVQRSLSSLLGPVAQSLVLGIGLAFFLGFFLLAGRPYFFAGEGLLASLRLVLADPAGNFMVLFPLLFFILPILLLLGSLFSVAWRLLTTDWRFTFDRNQRVLKRNWGNAAPFRDIDHLQLRQVHAHGTADRYRLNVILQDRGRIHLGETLDEQSAQAALAEIAALCGLPTEVRV